MIGRQVGNYQVLSLVAEDGLGFIYAGRHIAAGWPAALRHFLAPLSEVPLVQRYFAVAQRAGQVGHPSLLNAFESFWSGRNAFVVSEPIGGESLNTVLRRDRRLWPELCVKLAWQVASAMAAAHSNNLVHGSLRPESIFCWPDPELPGGYRAKIVDFGATVFLDVGAPDWRSPRVECLGLPLYMAPEQGRMGLCDYRSDVYSLGCILFQLACGRAPFPGGSPTEIMTAHYSTPVRGPQSFLAEIPAELDMLVQYMIAKDPGQRPLMNQVLAELQRISELYWPAQVALAPQQSTVQIDLKVGAPPPRVEKRRRIAPVLIGVGGLAVAGAVALLIARPWQAKGAAATEVAQTSFDAGAQAAVKPPEPPPAPPAPPAEPPPPSEKDKRLAEARKALAEERWADAATAARALQRLDAKNPEADKILKQARAEPQNQLAYEDFEKAAKDADDPAPAVKKWKKIPADSFYAKKAQPDYDKLRDDYMHLKEAEARALAETKKCAKLAAIEKQVAAAFPESVAAIQEIEKGCK